MKPIRVLVVDDSRSMRQLISLVLRGADDIEVVGEAADPVEARAAIKALDPDVITLDVEMPKMNGLDFLEKLMRLRPTPVIMVSNLTKAGGEATIRALGLGAVDCIAKPQLGVDSPFETLIEKVRVAVTAHVTPLRGDVALTETRARTDYAGPDYRPDGRIVAIGSSTGGVEALTTLLGSFPSNCPPTVIAQHMPPLFTKSFAERLNRICAPTVSEAVEGAPLLPGHVYIAPGSVSHHLEVAGKGRWRCQLRAGEAVSGHCPSVDVLFESVANVVGSSAIGVILTGMGRDGAAGLLAMQAAGARTIGQDASALIYGMPRVAYEMGAVQKQLSLARIGPEIIAATRT